MLNRMKQASEGTGPPSPHHRCGYSCLGPLTFHTGSVGARLTLGLGARRAERAQKTFQNGLAFSGRPVRVEERIRLRVELCDQHWEGALRLGFTTVPPSPGAPPAPMAIPDLTNMPGYWAAAVPQTEAQPGSELQFWVDSQGRVVFQGSSGLLYLLLEGVDVQQPLWAVIDVYGQTRAVLLLGSEKKDRFRLRTSCPTSPPPPVCIGDSCLCVSKGRRCGQNQISVSIPDPQFLATEDRQTVPPTGLHLEENCAICLSQSACMTLSCGHRCLCTPCALRVVEQFGFCPLCRQPITILHDKRDGPLLHTVQSSISEVAVRFRGQRSLNALYLHPSKIEVHKFHTCKRCVTKIL
ncbi:hypothetical protein AAFF_G00251640 [Aldrovandia affinis]|uniref:E3 ubiquitin-protein ligase NEURL1 n=1 Tax=Aldrovandia affinis TaxID=143900 RepID=A0AAD7STK7_9TELE|nr:hypothetical protein AAFF_G00251640 [Aldrovandia affinis]